MPRHVVAQINRLARHLVALRPHPNRRIEQARGRRVGQWIKLVDDAARAVKAATGGRYSRADFQRKTVTARAVEEFYGKAAR
jgi:hypothetical protein